MTNGVLGWANNSAGRLFPYLVECACVCSSAGRLGRLKGVKSVSADSGLQGLVILIFLSLTFFFCSFLKSISLQIL